MGEPDFTWGNPWFPDGPPPFGLLPVSGLDGSQGLLWAEACFSGGAGKAGTSAYGKVVA